MSLENLATKEDFRKLRRHVIVSGAVTMAVMAAAIIGFVVVILGAIPR